MSSPPEPKLPDLIVVGDLMVDVSVAAPALASGGDVRGSVRIRPGGGGANASAWAAREGARVRLHGAVGDDLAGRLVAGQLSERGVDLCLRTGRERPTGTMLVLREGGERSMVSDRGANALLSPSDLPERLMAKGLLVSAYVLFDPDSEAAGRTALERAEAEFIAVDAASWPLLERFGRNRFLHATRRADVLLVNRREAEALAPREREALTEHYRHVFLKLGSSGASYGTGDRWVSLPAPRVVESRDTTGAGDAFVGVLLAQLARGAPPEAALEQACVAGAEVARTGQNWPAAVS